jgi:hypothetical protein
VTDATGSKKPESTEALVVSNVEVSVAGLSATLRWKTSTAAAATVRFGGDEKLLLAAAGNGVDHTARLTGLAPGMTYPYDAVSKAANRTVVVSGTFTIGALPMRPVGGVSGAAVTVNSEPLFPILAWAQCPEDVDENIALGVNTFMNDCGAGAAAMSSALNERAYLVMPAEQQGTAQAVPELLGWHQPDEPDGYGIAPGELPDPAERAATGRPVFLTVTSGFNDPRTVAPYQEYFAKADIIGFDLYPLAHWCPQFAGHGRISLGSVFDQQRALVRQARGKPTYQWIEVNELERWCGAAPVGPAMVHAEVWLALAGGATGIGYFTHGWPEGLWTRFHVPAENQLAIAQTNAEIRSLQPLLSSPASGVTSAAGSVARVGARSYQGRIYVIAVNPSDTPQSISFKAVKLGRGNSTLRVWKQGRRVVARNGVVKDSVAPYGVNLYAPVR